MRSPRNRRPKLRPFLLSAVMFSGLVATIAAEPAAADVAETTCGNQANKNAPIKIKSLNISLDGQQVGNAQLIMGLAKDRNLPQRAAEVAIMASLQATSLGSSRLDTRGLFHQKPLYYPGVDVNSLTSSTNEFYARLDKVANWDKMTRGDAANAVQLAKDTATFSRWESAATELSELRWSAEHPTDCVEVAITDEAPEPEKPVTKSPQSEQPVDSTTSTTAAPTTAAPTTAAPTTAAPTTAAPTTAAPTTAPVTTKAPATTKKPTTTKAPATTKKPATTKAKPAPKTISAPAIRSTSNRNLKSVKGIVVRTSISKNLQQMLFAAEKEGVNLSGTGWRSPDHQIRLRRQNCGTSSFAIYKKSPSLCRPPTARPGTSNHETGLAIDFRNCGTRQTACYKWLKKNAGRYGFKNLPSESWHWSRNGR